MPALVKSKVGSPWGTSEELRTRRCPLLSKKRRKVSRISLPLQNFGFACVLLTLSSGGTDYRRVGGGAPRRGIGIPGGTPLPPFPRSVLDKRLSRWGLCICAF